MVSYISSKWIYFLKYTSYIYVISYISYNVLRTYLYVFLAKVKIIMHDKCCLNFSDLTIYKYIYIWNNRFYHYILLYYWRMLLYAASYSSLILILSISFYIKEIFKKGRGTKSKSYSKQRVIQSLKYQCVAFLYSYNDLYINTFMDTYGYTYTMDI